MRNPVGFVLSDDLLFSSRITGTADALGLRMTLVREVDDLLAQAGAASPACVVLDLHHPGLEVAAFLERLRAACPDMPRVVGYGSHVEAALLRAARQAGCDVVLPRSAFVERLPADLPAWLDPA